LTVHWIDGAVFLLCLGHVASALVVVAGSGDQRAALNMLWEWCGVAATYILMRWLLGSNIRRSLLLAVAATAVSLAGLGTWQHYGGFDGARIEYTKLKNELQSLERSGRPANLPAAIEWDRALNAIRVKLVQMGVPGDDGARMLWEARLNSSEAIGLFALANTLAGMLACLALVWLGVLIHADCTVPRWQIVTASVLTLIVLYCLLLTKSRTALVGLVVGLAVWMACVRLWRSAGRRRLRWVVAGLAAIVGLVTIAGVTGGLDRPVVSESAKSLRFRFEYWHGTWQMLLAKPRNWLVGVGPGNFRQNYLPFKLAQSSEEIADPHNLLLDAWANGGITAVLGLAGVCVAGLQPLFGGPQKMRPASDRGPGAPDAPPRHAAPSEGSQRIVPRSTAGAAGFEPSWGDGILGGAVLGHLAVLVPGGADETIFLLLLAWLCIVFLCGPLFRHDLPPFVFSAAFTALGVHLLGAGGIGMPAILQLLLLMAILGTDFDTAAGWSVATHSRWPVVAIGVAGAGLYVGCWLTGLLPVYSARAAIAVGESAWLAEGRAAKAEREFRRAADADPWSATAFERLSQLAYQSWLMSDRDSGEDFDRSIVWQREAIVRNPQHFEEYRTLGTMHLGRFQRTRETTDAEMAVEAFRRAASLYPNNALLQSELAESLWKAGATGPARDAARRAGELDAFNEQAGHIDKRLPAARVDLMQRILNAN
jgi:hypothetical protein